ncbi:hypothetical protein FRB93_012025 [Tulasnella sp. JGI-2019a]|nr:hypothetical protein FRB93_012025 [Tulasnella sp. JGI-2019a]
MFELLVLVAAIAFLYYGNDSVVSFTSRASVEGPVAPMDKTLAPAPAPTPTPSPPVYSSTITYHSESSPRTHFNYACEQSASPCPVCYPPPLRVFAPIDRNPKFAPHVHSSDCPMRPRWVYSRRNKTIPAMHNPTPGGFTTDDLVDLREVHSNHPDFDHTAPFIREVARDIPIINIPPPPPLSPYTAHNFSTPQSTPPPSTPTTPQPTSPYPPYIPAPYRKPTTIKAAANRIGVVHGRNEPHFEPATLQLASSAMDVDAIPPSFTTDEIVAMEVDTAFLSTPSTWATGVISMEVEPTPLPTSTMNTESSDLFNEDIILADATASIDDEDIVLVDVEAPFDDGEDAMIVDDEDVTMAEGDLDAESGMNGISRALAALAIADASDSDVVMVIIG